MRISLGKEIQGKPCLEDSEWSSTEVSDQLKSWFRSLFIVRKAGSRIVHALEVEVCLWHNADLYIMQACNTKERKGTIVDGKGEPLTKYCVITMTFFHLVQIDLLLVLHLH
jgi:hypothetical protein